MTQSARNAGNRRWEHFEHQADIGIRGIGPTYADAFEQAVTGDVSAHAYTQLEEPVRCAIERKVWVHILEKDALERRGTHLLQSAFLECIATVGRKAAARPCTTALPLNVESVAAVGTQRPMPPHV